MSVMNVLLRLCLVLIVTIALAPAAQAIGMPPVESPSDRPAQDDPPEDEPDQPEEQPEEESDRGDEPEEGAGGEEGDDAEAEDAEGEDKADEEAEEEAEEEEVNKDRYLAIVNASEIHTVTGPIVRNGTILTKNGRITAIGRNVKLPDDVEIIDATGRHVYPGMIPPFSSGLFGNSPLADTTDVYSLGRQIALAAGITASTSDNEAGKMTFGTTEGLSIRPDVFVELDYGPSEPSDTRRVRESLEGIIKYRRDLAEYERLKAEEDLEEDEESDLEAPDDSAIKGRNARFVALLDGDATALIEADDAASLLAIAELSEHYGIRVVIDGGVEAWTVADRLARGDISVIVSPRARQDQDNDLIRPNGSTIENAKVLRDHGIRVAFMPEGGLFGSSTGISLSGLGGRDLQHYFLTGAFAVRGGLSEKDAIRALTIDSAIILGIDDRVGSLEIGKDADMIVTDGNLLHYQTLVQQAIVNGRVEYDKQEAGILSHVRPDGNRNVTTEKPYEAWPRRLGEDW